MLKAVDYGDPANWLCVPSAPSQPVDVFFVYPTAWRAEPGESPIASIDNATMRRWARYYLDTRASAFATVGNIYAPYYRQFDAAFLFSQKTPEETIACMSGVPYADVEAAFTFYIEHDNGGRPFILVGHSQGSAIQFLLLANYMVKHPAVYQRMVAAYLIGVPVLRSYYDEYPHLKPAQAADDTGVIISYNTQAPCFNGTNPFANPKTVLINPVSWRTDGASIPASESKGSVLVDARTGKMTDAGPIASARIDTERGILICDVDAEVFSSEPASRAYLPLGVLHENDIPLYYYDLRANAELRARTWLGSPCDL
jgi:hypothetical protein